MKILRDNSIPSEEMEQIALADWLKSHPILKGLWYHCPNGGSRNVLEARKLKRMGVSSGVPDICIVYPSGRYHGAYIELKRRTRSSRLSDAQRDWLSRLVTCGYYVNVCYGFEEAIEAINDYLNYGGSNAIRRSPEEIEDDVRGTRGM